MLSPLVEGHMCISLTMISGHFEEYLCRRVKNGDDLQDLRRGLSCCVRAAIDRSSQKTSSLTGKG